MKKKSVTAAKDFLRLGTDMLESGNLETAIKALRVAVADLPRAVEPRLVLARALRKNGEVAEAAIVLTEALALTPVSRDAAGALSVLLQRFRLDEPDDLNPVGLKAALGVVGVDRQPIVRTAFQWLKMVGCLREVMTQAQTQTEAPGAGGEGHTGPDWDQLATLALATRKGGMVDDALLGAALESGLNTDREIELLWCAVRRRLVTQYSPADILADRKLFAFVLALVKQLDLNEHVWGVRAVERLASAKVAVDWSALAKGDVTATAQMLVYLLYHPVRTTPVIDWGRDQLARIRPKSLAAWIQPLVEMQQRERALAALIPQCNEIADAVSQRVAAQYENSPYPRWTTLNLQAPAVRLQRVTTLFGAEMGNRLQTAAFDVLVAGCGTGHHAAQLAVAYGKNARILGVDISRASLAYGWRMAEMLGVERVSFAQADLLDARAIGRSFDVIECIGVLHHMADPFAGWRSVLEVLKPGGIMFVGLYSAVARQVIGEIRGAPDYPGPGCDDDAARAYRLALMGLPDDAPGAVLKRSQDFYALSDFRDLVLHENEIRLQLEEIAAFLDAAGLVFGGFEVPHAVEKAFLSAFPDDALPGRLANWAAFEQANPDTFEGMYNFWCGKPA